MAKLRATWTVRDLRNVRDRIPEWAWEDLLEQEGDTVIGHMRSFTDGGKIMIGVQLVHSAIDRVKEILRGHGLLGDDGVVRQEWESKETRGEWEQDPDAWKNA